MFHLNQYYIGGFYFVSTVSFFTYIYWKTYFNLLKPEKKVPKLSQNEIYAQSIKDNFIKCYENNKFNENIQSEFYEKEQYAEMITRKDNILDTTWKSRILFENTPQGNVIMFYNAYKHGFSYYSDNNISNTLLNIVAMKYVSKFFCRDFFIDNSIIPKNFTSPFLHVHEIDLNQNKTKTKIDVNKGPFAKLKKYDKPKPKLIETKKQKLEPYVQNNIKNKFLFLGKIYKFYPLQKVKNETQTTEVKKPIAMNYSSFKQWHNPEKFDLTAT